MKFNHSITWANQNVTPSMVDKIREFNNYHWSRVFEYPWVAEKGDFKQGQWVLDAAGGDSSMQFYLAKLGCRVINVDLETPQLKQDSVLRMVGDLKKLPFLNSTFSRIVCVSVLEHIENPKEVVKELCRVLDVGGKLLLTFDVANYKRWNHTVDVKVAEDILSEFEIKLPSEPNNILEQSFPEIKRLVNEPSEVHLKVLCLCLEKLRV